MQNKVEGDMSEACADIRELMKLLNGKDQRCFSEQNQRVLSIILCPG